MIDLDINTLDIEDFFEKFEVLEKINFLIICQNRIVKVQRE